MAIPDKIIDEIQEKTDIVEVISRYVPLKKTGRSYKAPCPFHHEKTPSFIVSQDKQIYHCFGCGVGGNVFSFLMKYENLQFPEAVEMLAEKAGVRIPRSSYQKQEENSLTNQLYKINEEAAGFFQSCLANSSQAREYLISRGINQESVKLFRIGYAPDSWESLINFFGKRGTASPVLEKAGLAIANDKGSHYDRFRSRIVFPILDLKDRIVGFGARVMDSSLPKYINSPETVIYSKGRNLYGLNICKEDIKKAGHVLVVEGYLDAIIPYQAGVKNIIATLGTALTVDQTRMLKRFVNTVIMVYDPDEAGEAASIRNLDLFISEDINVYIAELPTGLDPDNYMRKYGAEDFIKLIKSSKNLFNYKMDKLVARFDINAAHGKAGIAGEMLPTISRINNAVFKSDLIKKLAERLRVDEESLRTELKKVKPDYNERRYLVTPVEAKKDSKSAEMMILALLLDREAYIETVRSRLSPEEFKDCSVRDLVASIFAMYGKGQITPARLINHLGNKDQSAVLISEAINVLEMLVDKNKTLEDCISRIKRDNIKDQLDRLQDAIKVAHDQKDDMALKHLVTEYNGLVRTHKA